MTIRAKLELGALKVQLNTLLTGLAQLSEETEKLVNSAASLSKMTTDEEIKKELHKISRECIDAAIASERMAAVIETKGVLS